VVFNSVEFEKKRIFRLRCAGWVDLGAWVQKRCDGSNAGSALGRSTHSRVHPATFAATPKSLNRSLNGSAVRDSFGNHSVQTNARRETAFTHTEILRIWELLVLSIRRKVNVILGLNGGVENAAFAMLTDYIVK
jgi:hypothetical protein